MPRRLSTPGKGENLSVENLLVGTQVETPACPAPPSFTCTRGPHPPLLSREPSSQVVPAVLQLRAVTPPSRSKRCPGKSCPHSRPRSQPSPLASRQQRLSVSWWWSGSLFPGSLPALPPPEVWPAASERTYANAISTCCTLASTLQSALLGESKFLRTLNRVAVCDVAIYVSSFGPPIPATPLNVPRLKSRRSVFPSITGRYY